MTACWMGQGDEEEQGEESVGAFWQKNDIFFNFFFFYLTLSFSLNIMASHSIYFVANGRIFFLMAELVF